MIISTNYDIINNYFSHILIYSHVDTIGKRLFNSDIGWEILKEAVEKAKSAGMFAEENLHVIDSFMVWGASARQDTYTMIYQGIKMVLRVLSNTVISTCTVTGSPTFSM